MAPPRVPAGDLSKHEAAYRTLRQRILEGRYGPGYRLVLSGLARDLEVSPVPIREAIRRLEAEGLVTFERNVGARVATLTDDAWEELVEMLALLDGYAVRQAQPMLTPEILAEAEQINAALRRQLTGGIDNEAVMALHRRFHRLIYSRAANTYLVDALDQVWDRIDASRVLVSLYPAKRLASAVDEHDELLQRLRQERVNPSDLEQFARWHNLNAAVTIRNARGR
ncbi:GntR family transcriptional regulator [Actinoplanes subtropicus]|uniref:GntR family transcriptional regulator n=1 Tax=Actinoplanes subtropicus TaxID=543632 RepID=UPI0004C34D81|nr:GntR family transcriptional regulator [Actinoplanes subtropicus]